MKYYRLHFTYELYASNIYCKKVLLTTKTDTSILFYELDIQKENHFVFSVIQQNLNVGPECTIDTLLYPPLPSPYPTSFIFNTAKHSPTNQIFHQKTQAKKISINLVSRKLPAYLDCLIL